MDFGILTVFWYFGPLQFQNENASILLMKSAPRGPAAIRRLLQRKARGRVRAVERLDGPP